MAPTKIIIYEVYEELEKRAKEVGLNISVEKTKEIIQNGKTRRRINEI
jgi:hypothetical protein